MSIQSRLDDVEAKLRAKAGDVVFRVVYDNEDGTPGTVGNEGDYIATQGAGGITILWPKRGQDEG